MLRFVSTTQTYALNLPLIEQTPVETGSVGTVGETYHEVNVVEQNRVQSGGALVLVGSCAVQARSQVERLVDEGALLLTLTRETLLNQDESVLMGLRSAAAAAVRQGRTVVVRSENWPEAREVTRRLAARRGVPPAEIESRVGLYLGRVAEGALKALGHLKLVVVGTDTCGAVCRHLGVAEPTVPAAAQTVLAGGAQPVRLLCRAGAAGGPGALIDAVQTLE